MSAIEKIASRSYILIPRALAGDPIAIALLASAGIALIHRSVRG